MAARHREGQGSRRPVGGGNASQPPGPTAGSHRQRPPSTGAVPRHARDDGLAPPTPSRGLTPTATDTHPRAAAGRGERSPAAHRRPTPVPDTRKAPPPRPAPPRGRHRPTEAGGRHPREARPARSQTGDGSAGRSHARDEEERPAAAGRGRQARTAGAAGQGRGRRPGTRKTPGTRPGHQENQRGVPPPPTHEGGPATRLGRRPVPAIPGAGPHDPAPPPGPGCRPAHLPPSVLDRSVFHLA